MNTVRSLSFGMNQTGYGYWPGGINPAGVPSSPVPPPPPTNTNQEPHPDNWAGIQSIRCYSSWWHAVRVAVRINTRYGRKFCRVSGRYDGEFWWYHIVPTSAKAE